MRLSAKVSDIGTIFKNGSTIVMRLSAKVPDIGYFTINLLYAHKIPINKIIVVLDLKLARILPEKLRKTSWNLKAPFTHVFRNPGA